MAKAAKAVRKEPWFAYFPDDYRWSAGVGIAYSTSYWGSSTMGEVDRVCRKLKGKIGDDDAWFAEWVSEADRMRALGLAAARKKNDLSAAAFFKRACFYYQLGERFRTPKDKAANAAYRKSLDSFKRFAALTDAPRIEHVEIPFEGKKTLPGVLIHAQNTRKRKPPVVVSFDGFDVSKEIQYILGAEDLVRRGMSVLAVDAPGNGEAIRFRKLYLRHDHETAGAAALDYLESRNDVDAKRAGVMAISLGGYYAPRNASMEHRFKACVAWGAIWDYQRVWRDRIAAAYKTALSVPGHHLEWIFNLDSTEECLDVLADFKLEGVVQNMRCPFLLIHGEGDQQIPLADAKRLFNASGSKDKTLRIVKGTETGAQHCQMDNVPPYAHEIFDWLKLKLGA